MKEIIGYNCKVCHGKNFRESGDVITHICPGFAEPVLEDKPKPPYPNWHPDDN